jgi:RecQ family ATP-dependent DNA helicase
MEPPEVINLDDDSEDEIFRKKTFKRIKIKRDSDDEEVSIDRKSSDSLEESREASFPEPDIPNGYLDLEAEEDHDYFDTTLDDFELEDDIHGDDNEDIFPDDDNDLNVNVDDMLGDIGSSPILTPEPEETCKRELPRSPLVDINIQASPIRSRKRGPTGIPKNNLEEMIQYVASFDLKKKIKQLNPGKPNIDVDAVIAKMKRSGGVQDNQNPEMRDDFGVHDTPSFSVPFTYRETAPSSTFIPHRSEPPALQSHAFESTQQKEQQTVNLDDITFGEDDFGDFGVEDDLQELPISFKTNTKQPLCSTFSASGGSMIATKEPFQITLNSTSGPNFNESFHEWDRNHGDDNNFKRFDYPFSIKMLDAFRKVFGMESFRTNQQEAVTAALLGHDCFILMPTGGGKSLCYQLPAIISRGVTVVISPLKSLIYDQVTKLKSMNIHVEYMSGDMNKSQACQVYNELKEDNPSVKLLYVTPERIGASPALNCVFDEMFRKGTIERFVIDEAHCVSQWGHDFRPDYKKLSCLRQKYKTVPIMAVTATANPRVRLDVETHLKLEGCKWFIQTFNRPNLKYEVRRKVGKSLDDIINLISNRFLNDTGIIYCLSQKDCETTAKILTSRGIKALPYHAGLEDKVKNTTQNDWMSGKIKVICATIAFGMGIDKPNVRFVIHFCVAKSMEGYYQEAGRAGRDGLLSFCYLFFSQADVARLVKIMSKEPPKSNAEIESKKIHMENLNAMTFYAYNKAVCRRVQLTRYLGEGTKLQSLCKGSDPRAFCDNCETKETFTQADVTKEAQVVVQCVKELECRSSTKMWTMNHYLSIFAGSELKPIKEAGHDKLPAYGKLRHLRKTDQEFLLRKLVIDGYLREKVQMLQGSQIANVYLVAGKQSYELLKAFPDVKVLLPLHNDPLVRDSAYIETVDTPGTNKRQSKGSQRPTTETTSRYHKQTNSRGRGSTSAPKRGKNVDFFVNEDKFDEAFDTY